MTDGTTTVSAADLRMRRLLRVPPSGGSRSTASADNLFSVSIAISAVRCLITYVLVPLLAPVLHLTGTAGPALGLAAGTASVIAIVASMRRFWMAHHPWRWRYAAGAGAILVFVLAAGIVDTVRLAT